MLRIIGGIYMIELEEKTLQSFLYKAIDEAISLRKQPLFSWTKKIDKVDLIDVFQAAENTKKDRLFWTNSSNDFALVGVGCTHKMIGHEDRFEQLQKEWKNILQEAIIHDHFKDVGTGLVALGGMSFDPKREKSGLWAKYPTSQLTIPAYMVVKNNSNYYLTMNRYLTNKDNIEQIIHEVNMMEKILLTETEHHHSTQKVIAKKEIAPNTWKKTVQKAVDEIKQNRAKKIVLAREMRLKLNKDANIAGMLKKLINTQPNSYIFAFEQGDNCFLGATPERLVQVQGDKLLSTCLAGTAPRGKTKEEDATIARSLLFDQKNREEHDYVVQMIKQNIEKYCEAIDIPKEPVIYPLRNLQHLYTPVTAKLKPSYTVFDIIKKLHPTPALGGVPREKALAFIREEERLDRGWYGAPIGWLDSNKNSEFAVAIRSGLIQKDEVSLFAGCGVMRDSDPEMEYDETNVKFLPMLHIMEANDESY